MKRIQSNEKTIYEKPEMDMTEFCSDVITLSGFDEGDGESGGFSDFGINTFN